MKTFNFIVLLILAVSAWIHAQAFPQEIPSEDKRITDQQAVTIFKALREVTRPQAGKVFPIYSYQNKVSHAASLGEGKLLAKWSEVGRRPQLYTRQGARGLRVRIVGVYPEHDLAVLEAPGLTATAVEWSTDSQISEGSLLAAVRPDGEAVSVGALSVPARSLRDADQGLLGINIDARSHAGKVVIAAVTRSGAAHKAGILPGDFLISINGQKVKGFYDTSSLLRRLKAGSTAEIIIEREGREQTVKPVLDSWFQQFPDSQRLNHMDQMSGSQSLVRDEFPNVIQSDMELEADGVGMPVVDLRGKVIGMVIARAGRISTLILPAEVIQQALKKPPLPVNR